MIYINTETGDKYYGGAMTYYHDGVLFSGIPTSEQLESWGYTVYVPPTPPEPTEEELKRARMDEIRQQLSDTDYIVLKKAEGQDISPYDVKYNGNFLAWRQGLRDEYNRIEMEIQQ